jgi:HEAT repeats
MQAESTITIKSQYEPGGPQGQPRLVFQFPAMALETPTGAQLIPNPNGRQAASFASLEAAMAAIHQAGFDALWQDRLYPLRRGQPSEKAAVELLALADPVDQAAAQLVAPLLARLGDREVPVLTASLEALGYLKAPGLLEAIETLLDHESPEVRQSLAGALSQLGTAARDWVRMRYDATLDTTGKQRPDVYRIRLTLMAVYTEMAKAHGPVFMVPVMGQLHQGLSDGHWLVRAQAAQALYFWALRRDELKLVNHP